jgi:glutamine synthetase type III
MAQARKEIFTAIVNSTPRRVEEKHWNNAKEFIETFADEVLTDEILRNLVPDSTWKAYQKARQDPHHDIDAQTADQIANAMKEWALSKGKFT